MFYKNAILTYQKVTLSILTHYLTIHPTSYLLFFSHYILIFFLYYLRMAIEREAKDFVYLFFDKAKDILV